jgi:hypothetical protein
VEVRVLSWAPDRKNPADAGFFVACDFDARHTRGQSGNLQAPLQQQMLRRVERNNTEFSTIDFNHGLKSMLLSTLSMIAILLAALL